MSRILGFGQQLPCRQGCPGICKDYFVQQSRIKLNEQGKPQLALQMMWLALLFVPKANRKSSCEPDCISRNSGNAARAMIRRAEVVAAYTNFVLISADYMEATTRYLERLAF